MVTVPRRPTRRIRVLPPPATAHAPRSTQLPRTVAAAVAIAGLITLLSSAFAMLRGRIEVLSNAIPLAVRIDAASVAALAGFGLLVIAGGLARRQRRAWAVAIALLLVAGVSHLIKDVDVVASAVNIGVACVLVMARREFDAKAGPGTIRRAILAVPILAATAWSFGWVAIMAHVGSGSHASVATAAVASLRGLVGLPLGIPLPGEAQGWLVGFLPVLGVAVLVTAVVTAFRPVVEGLRRSPSDSVEAGRLVRRYGTDTLSYFGLREDKSSFFHGEAMVSYRYLWNVALVSGDPIGRAEDVPEAFEAFVRHARGLGWGVAVLAGGADLADVYARLGLRGFYLGDEAILDPRTFSLDGRPIRKVRQSCHRLERAGYTLGFVADPDVGPDLREALASVTRAWRGRAPERGFTMALGEAVTMDRGCLTVVARDPAGRAQGYLHLVPCFGADPGFSLDQMRRRPDTPNGLTEWMVARTAEELGRRGVGRLSLNFAFLGGLFREREHLSRLQRVEVGVAQWLNPFFQIESLQSFNAKFFPAWYPRYIYYETPLSFPRVALAYLEAEAFLQLPLIGMRGRLRARIPTVSDSARREARSEPDPREAKGSDRGGVRRRRAVPEPAPGRIGRPPAPSPHSSRAS
jgi:lysylphosphatidylglycerol synthetase-like protein (DUF2156 family)